MRKILRSKRGHGKHSAAAPSARAPVLVACGLQ
jgi:hypothetical protein